MMTTILTVATWATVALVWAVPAMLLWFEWDEAGRSWRRMIRRCTFDAAIPFIMGIAMAAWFSVAAPVLVLGIRF